MAPPPGSVRWSHVGLASPPVPIRAMCTRPMLGWPCQAYCSAQHGTQEIVPLSQSPKLPAMLNTEPTWHHVLGADAVGVPTKVTWLLPAPQAYW